MLHCENRLRMVVSAVVMGCFSITWDAIYNYRFGGQQQGRMSFNVQNLTRYLPSGQIRGPAQGRRYGPQFSYLFEDI